MAEFHPHTPTNKCPPEDALPSDKIYYRVVFNNPPVRNDFIIWILEPENNHLLEEKMKKGDCSSFALSMFTEKGMHHIEKLFLRQMQKKAEKKKANFIGWAKIKLEHSTGVIKQTGEKSHHFDFWPYINCELECKVLSVEGI